MIALYPGKCRVCGGAIDVGDRIEYGGPKRGMKHAPACPPKGEAQPATAKAVSTGDRR